MVARTASDARPCVAPPETASGVSAVHPPKSNKKGTASKNPRQGLNRRHLGFATETVPNREVIMGLSVTLPKDDLRAGAPRPMPVIPSMFTVSTTQEIMRTDGSTSIEAHEKQRGGPSDLLIQPPKAQPSTSP